MINYETLNLGTPKPSAVPMQTIDVVISAENMLGQYSKAFVAECFRVQPLLMERPIKDDDGNIIQDTYLTVKEVEDYSRFLLHQRVLSVHDECPLFRKLKSLYIPAWIQFSLSMVGIVYLRQFGIKLNPVIESEDTISLEEAYAISEKIGSFESTLQVVKDAMPRSNDGSVDVMSTALIAGYMRSIKEVTHVSATYVSAFLGMKLVEEQAFEALYRVQYDDIEFIRTALTARKELFT